MFTKVFGQMCFSPMFFSESKADSLFLFFFFFYLCLLKISLWKKNKSRSTNWQIVAFAVLWNHVGVQFCSDPSWDCLDLTGFYAILWPFDFSNIDVLCCFYTILPEWPFVNEQFRYCKFNFQLGYSYEGLYMVLLISWTHQFFIRK